jgi:anti-sigma factor RsiW
MSDALHPSSEALDAWVDGVLDAPARAELEAHARACEVCAEELRTLAALKRQLRESAAPSGDAEFEARIRSALDAEDARCVASARRRRWLRIGAAASAAAALALWIALPRAVDLPAEAAALARRSGALPSERIEAAALEERFNGARLPFTPRVLDLRMMGWEIAAGEVGRTAQQRSTRILYRDARGRMLLCLMLAALASELPDDATRFTEGGIAFFAYSRGEVTVVAWAEGDVLCFLAGALPPAEVRALAVAKAMLPSSAGS